MLKNPHKLAWTRTCTLLQWKGGIRYKNKYLERRKEYFILNLQYKRQIWIVSTRDISHVDHNQGDQYPQLIYPQIRHSLSLIPSKNTPSCFNIRKKLYFMGSISFSKMLLSLPYASLCFHGLLCLLGRSISVCCREYNLQSIQMLPSPSSWSHYYILTYSTEDKPG